MSGVNEKPSVVAALSAVMAEVQAVGKGDRNNEQGYNFRGIDAVINAVGPVFRKHGVIAVPVKCEAKYRDVLTSREKRSRECTVAVTYRFYGPAGDFIDCEVPGESMDFGDKGAPKAMSVAYRIALLQTLCIPTHDPEPDAQSYERGSGPAWDPIEQDTLRAGYQAEIEDAKSTDEISAIGRRVLSAKRSGEISPAMVDYLTQIAATRKAELNGGARDSTGDSDGGGAEPGPVGEGPRPDGEGAGGGGPGRDGETSRARPGVQPSVHRRAGVSGSAQTSGDDRNTPAAVGGRRG